MSIDPIGSRHEDVTFWSGGVSASEERTPVAPIEFLKPPAPTTQWAERQASWSSSPISSTSSRGRSDALISN
jgi:hypothetical protein